MVALLSPAECNPSRRTSSDEAATTSLRAFGPNRIFTWSGVTAAAGTFGFGAAAGFGRVTGGARRAAAAGVDDAAGARTAAASAPLVPNGPALWPTSHSPA